MTGRVISLSAGTVLDVPPEAAIAAAAEAGFDGIGLRWDRAAGARPPAGLRHRLDDAGLTLLDLEVVRLGPSTPAREQRPWAEAAAELGARFLLAVSSHPDPARTADELATLAGWCEPAGVTVALEFMRFTAVRTFAEATATVAAAGATNLTVLVDALHLQRGGETPATLAGVAPGTVGYVQLCDAPGSPAVGPADDAALAHEARHARLFPGDGELPLVDLLAALPGDLPCAVEVQSDRYARRDVGERARLALSSARKVLDVAGARPVSPVPGRES